VHSTDEKTVRCGTGVGKHVCRFLAGAFITPATKHSSLLYDFTFEGRCYVPVEELAILRARACICPVSPKR
jgi:hypothetical protein